MPLSMSEILKATRLTRQGHVMDATRLIQRALGLARSASPPSPTPPTPSIPPIPSTPANRLGVSHEEIVLLEAPPAEILARPVEIPVQPTLPVRPASFTEHDFTFSDRRYFYHLYIPGMAATDVNVPPQLPLVVMLHGCKQDAADFAQGTDMNELAERQKCIVLYPEQLVKSNGMRCWNWFDTAHQSHDAGEPGMIAALTRQVLDNHNADPARVYIAGLSAGGAMAAVVAGLYPSLYAAVGVHSGLPSGAARDVITAFSAMRNGARRRESQPEPAKGRSRDEVNEKARATPTIVFHGSADNTVHPDNGEHVIEVALAAMIASDVSLVKIQRAEKGPADGVNSGSTRNSVRTIYRTADGRSQVEHWSVASGPHAWSCGNSAGSYTDPQGPDASRAMLEFFLLHHK